MVAPNAHTLRIHPSLTSSYAAERLIPKISGILSSTVYTLFICSITILQVADFAPAFKSGLQGHICTPTSRLDYNSDSNTNAPPGACGWQVRRNTISPRSGCRAGRCCEALKPEVPLLPRRIVASYAGAVRISVLMICSPKQMDSLAPRSGDVPGFAMRLSKSRKGDAFASGQNNGISPDLMCRGKTFSKNRPGQSPRRLRLTGFR